MIAWLIARGVAPNLAKPLLIAAGVIALLVLLGVGKCTYDRSVIRNHTNEQAAETAKADRKADATAAEQRRLDDSRANTERLEISDAIEEAAPDPASRRAAYYSCLARLQDARRRGVEPPSC